MPDAPVTPKLDRPKPDGRRPGRPYHYASHYTVTFAPSVGKPGLADVVLCKKRTAGTDFKQSVVVVKAWRGLTGEAFNQALERAHELRRTLDTYWRR